MVLRAHLVSFLQPDREMEGVTVLHTASIASLISRVLMRPAASCMVKALGRPSVVFLCATGHPAGTVSILLISGDPKAQQITCPHLIYTTDF